MCVDGKNCAQTEENQSAYPRLYNTQSYHYENDGNDRKSFRYDNYENEQQYYQQKQQHAPLSTIHNNKQKLTVKTKYLDKNNDKGTPPFNVVQTKAKMNIKINNQHLFDAIATASVPIIRTFTSQALANTVNAYARLDISSPQLFDEAMKVKIRFHLAAAAATVIVTGSSTSAFYSTPVPVVVRRKNLVLSLQGNYELKQSALRSCSSTLRKKATAPVTITDIVDQNIQSLLPLSRSSFMSLRSSKPEENDDKTAQPSSSSSILTNLSKILSTLTSLFPFFVLSFALMGYFQPSTLLWVSHGKTVEFMLSLVMCGMGLTLSKDDFVRATDKKNRSLVPLSGTAAISIIRTFNSQELANVVNAYARMNINNPQLFDEVAKAACPIIDTFSSQALSNTVNAYAKMGINNTPLFEEVAMAIIPIIRTFTPQALANTINAFAKLNINNTQLFDEIADTTISITDAFNSQDLSIGRVTCKSPEKERGYVFVPMMLEQALQGEAEYKDEEEQAEIVYKDEEEQVAKDYNEKDDEKEYMAYLSHEADLQIEFENEINMMLAFSF